eukprot:jgi/Chlat1/2208/Chrsp17S00190
MPGRRRWRRRVCSVEALGLGAWVWMLLAGVGLAGSTSLAAPSDGGGGGAGGGYLLDLLAAPATGTLREACYAAVESREHMPGRSLQCERSPPCIPMEFFHSAKMDEPYENDYMECLARPRISDWPTWDPYVEAADVDGHTTMGQLAELVGNKTVLFIGDSVMYQTYYSLMCGLARSGELGNDTRSEPIHALVKELGASFGQAQAATKFGTLFVFARVNMYLPERLAGLLKLADIVIINYGLHYGVDKAETYIRDMDMLGQQLDQFAGQHDKTVIVRGLSAQHFPHSGAWNLSDPVHRSNCTCSRIEPGLAAMNYMVQRSRNLLFLPMLDLTINRYDMHLQMCYDFGANSSDWSGCCDSFWDQLAARLLRLLLKEERYASSSYIDTSTQAARRAAIDHFRERQMIAHLKFNLGGYY